jgi:hypothetical protein
VMLFTCEVFGSDFSADTDDNVTSPNATVECKYVEPENQMNSGRLVILQ